MSDNDRLLTDEELTQFHLPDYPHTLQEMKQALAQAQDLKTARIKDAEVAELKAENEAQKEFFANELKAVGAEYDKRVAAARQETAREIFKIFERFHHTYFDDSEWQALKSRYGVGGE